MTIENAYAIIYSFLMTHQLIALGGLVVLALFLWKAPTHFFKFILVFVGIVVIFYVLTYFMGAIEPSMGDKKQMIYKTESTMSE